jgi:SEC-C motif domain protein
VSKSSSNADCPCRLREPQQLSYGQCCQAWHLGLGEGKHAPTAEALMRSRYSAYALAKRNDEQGHAMLRYLLGTWHVSTAPGEIELGPTQWIGLDVVHALDGVDAAIVEFIAYLKVNGKAEKMHEVSRFFRVDGAWKYIDGEIS